MSYKKARLADGPFLLNCSVRERYNVMPTRKPADRVYLIRCVNENVVQYKIGNTGRGAQHRIKDMETSNPGDMSVVAEYFTNLATTLETVLHKHYAGFLKKGEWFTFADGDISKQEFLSVCSKSEDSLRSVNLRLVGRRNIPPSVRSTFEDMCDDILL